MSLLRGALAVATADFLERVRRHRTLVTTAAMVGAANVFLPRFDSRYITMQIDNFRPAYSSAYVGLLCAILCGVFLSFAGFYLVKDAVDRDRATRVGEILASTPLTRLAYVTGKWLSNMALLTGMIAVVAIAAGGLQLLRGEDMRLDLWALVAPFLWIALPPMAVTASVAVFFEVVPWLRGGFGNVVFFIVWITMLQTSGSLSDGRYPPPGADFVGFSAAMPSIYQAQARAYPQEPARLENFSAGLNFHEDANWRPRTFEWPGVEWSVEILSRRFAWLAGAFGLLGVSSLIFDRFQRQDEPKRPRRRRKSPSSEPEIRGAPASAPLEVSLVDAAPAAAVGAPAGITHLSALPANARRPTLAPLIVQEFVLLMKGTSRWWWVPILGLTVGACFAPLPVVLEWLLPILWIWPMLHWSSLGGREQRHGTVELTMSAPRPVLRPVLASWMAGVALAILVAVAVLVRVLIAGAWGHLAGIVAGACFIPAFAIALGAWTGSGKLFEVLYMLLWYLAINRVAVLDYTGGSAEAVARGLPLLWAGLAASFLALALGGRMWLARR